MAWKNGYIDERELVIFKRGRNSTDGDWFHGLSPATYARHLELVRIAKARTGRTLEISEGWGAYRPFAAQVKAQQIYGIGAAKPGTSSHGGYWERKETMAMDYSNWSWVYGGNRGAFYEDVRKAGLVPGQIEPSRGYPDEPWHVIDVNPRVMPSFAGGGSNPLEEDDMFSDQDRRDLQMIAKRLRGPEDRPVDMLQSIEGLASETRNRLRGPEDRPYDMLQSIEGPILDTHLRIRGPQDQPYDMIQLIASAVTGKQPVEVTLSDDDKQKLASLIADLIPTTVGSLSDGAVEHLVKTLLDEQARRLSS